MHDLQKWSEDEVTIQRRTPEPAIIQHTPAKDSPRPPNTGAKTRRALALEKEKLNVRYKDIQQLVEPNSKN